LAKEVSPKNYCCLLVKDDPESIWVFPGALTANDLDNNLRLLKRFVDDPPTFEEGKTGADLLRRKIGRKDDSNSSGSQSSDSEDSETSDRPRKRKKKRKQRTLDDVELEQRREKRRIADLEKRAMIKSAVRVIDSDDDDDADTEFFERERQLRERMARKADEGALPVHGTKKRATKKKGPEPHEKSTISAKQLGGVDFEASINHASQASINLHEIDNDVNGLEDEDDLKLVKKRRIRRAISISSDSE